MEWQTEIKKLYDNVILKMPEFARPIVGPLLLEKAEMKCEERQGKDVAERDLIIALFEVTPPAIQPTMIADIKSLGVNYEKWLVFVKGGFQHSMDINQTVKDLIKVGEIADVKCNEEAIWKVLNAYKDFFSGSSLSIRTTTKPIEERDVSIRYVELMIPHDPDPYVTAINEGLIEKDEHPLHKLFYEASENFEVMGNGVDLDVRVGLTKLWSFIAPSPIEPVYSMTSIPDSVKQHKDYFLKHGLTVFVLFAFDYYHKTVNLYFLIKDPSKIKREKYEALLKDLDFEIALPEVMDRCCEAITIYYTFNWESDIVERVCFGIVCPEGKEQVPVHFHPLMKKFVDNVPIRSEERKFIYSITFTRNGHFFKVENDYNGTMIELLKMGSLAGLDLP